MQWMYNCDSEHEVSDITIPTRQVTNFVEQNKPVSTFEEGLTSHLTTDFLDTADQNMFKLTLRFHLKSQSCCGSYQPPYHFFNIRVKHVPEIFRSLNWKLCWQIVNGTHQNPGAFNTRRINKLYRDAQNITITLYIFPGFISSQHWFHCYLNICSLEK